MTASRWPIRWQRSSAWSCMRRRPLELEERDVRRARERDALARRRASRRRAAAGRRGPGTRGPSSSRAPSASRAEQVRRVREALEHRAAGPRRGGRRRRAARPTRGSRAIHGSAARELAARRQPLERRELREALGAQRRGDPRVELARGRAAARAARRRRRCSARRYSRSLSSATGTTTWRLAGSCGRTSRLQPPHEAAPAQVPVQALLASAAPGTGARSARRSRSPRGGR